MNIEKVVLEIYLAFLGLQLLFEIYLLRLNIRQADRHADTVPEFFSQTIELPEYQRSLKYTQEKNILSMFNLVYSTCWLIFWASFGWYGAIERYLQTWQLSPDLQGVALIFTISFLFSVIQLPFQLYSTFIIEARYGFNKTTAGIWLSDLLKSLILSAVLMTPLLLGIFAAVDYFGEAWWIFAFLLVAGFQLLLAAIFPRWIAPWFNKFTPLSDPELRSDLQAFAEKLGFRAQAIFVADGSRRSTHGNAYFTGFGRNKRIVFYDTLLEQIGTQGLKAILAHEIGHEKLGHIKKSLALSLLFLAGGFFALGQALHYQPLFSAFGFQAASLPALLILASIVLEPLGFFIKPLFSILSRAFEYQADRFAVSAMQGSTELRESLLLLSKKNLGNLVPHPWYSFFHYSHPALYERLLAMERYADSQK